MHKSAKISLTSAQLEFFPSRGSVLSMASKLGIFFGGEISWLAGRHGQDERIGLRSCEVHTSVEGASTESLYKTVQMIRVPMRKASFRIVLKRIRLPLYIQGDFEKSPTCL